MLVPVHIPSHPNALRDGVVPVWISQTGHKAQGGATEGAPAESRVMCTCIPPYGSVQGTRHCRRLHVKAGIRLLPTYPPMSSEQ